MINFYMLYAFDRRYDPVWDLPRARRNCPRRMQRVWSSSKSIGISTTLRLVFFFIILHLFSVESDKDFFNVTTSCHFQSEPIWFNVLVNDAFKLELNYILKTVFCLLVLYL